MTGGIASLNWRESKGPLTDTVDVVRGDLLSFAELPRRFVGFFVKLPLPHLEVALQQRHALRFRLDLFLLDLKLPLLGQEKTQVEQRLAQLVAALFVRALH